MSPWIPKQECKYVNVITGLKTVYGTVWWRRSLFTNFSKPILADVNIHVQYYTKQNVTRSTHYIYNWQKQKYIRTYNATEINEYYPII